ncbi:MAG TPA: MFS transporter [Dehalococcoidia bacterium]|nr:MFS transporter [Dehalococcoidia bacterium]
MSRWSGRETSPIFYGWVILAAASVIAIVCHGMQYSFGVFLKPLSEGLDWVRPLTAGAASTYYLCRAAASISMGGLSDRVGPRVVVGLGGLLVGSGMMLGGLIKSPWHLYLFYGMLVGTGMGTAYTPLSATVARWFEQRRGFALGVVEASCGGGGFLFAPISGYLIVAYGWSLAYVIVGFVALVFILSGAWFLKRGPELKPLTAPVPDPAGTAGGLTLRRAFGLGRYWALVLLSFVLGLAQFTVLTNIVAHATDHGVGELQAPFLVSIIGAVWVVGSLGLGALSDRFGGRPLLLLGAMVFALCVMSLNLTADFGLLCFLMAVAGLFLGGAWVVVAKIIAELFGLRAIGAIWGSVLTLMLVGAAVGAVVPNIIYQLTQPHSYAVAFWMVGGMVLAGVGIFFLSTRRIG